MNEYVVEDKDDEKEMGSEGLLVRMKPDKPENSERMGDGESMFRFICWRFEYWV